jgi:hypothetical protein
MTFKKILSLILVCFMLMSVLSLTACGGNDDNNDDENSNEGGENNTTTDKTYTVNVIDRDHNPVEGVKLVITDENTYPTATTDASGRASVQLPDGSVYVMITSVPSGYVKPEKTFGVYHAMFPSGMIGLTIILDKEESNTVNYSVKVVDQNGDAVEGMQIQLCPDGVCLADQFITNANGEITKEMTPGKTVDVKLYDLAGYTLPAANDHGYHAVIAEGETEITITVTKN